MYTPSSIIQTIIRSNAANERYENILNGMTALKNNIKMNSSVNIDDILPSYDIYAYKTHKFTVPTYGYYQRLIPLSAVNFASDINFPLNNTEQFISDIVLNVKIEGVGSDLSGPALSHPNALQYHYCDYPGVRIAKQSTFLIDDQVYEQYYPENSIMYRQLDLATEYRRSWDICHGQEQPIEGFMYMPDNQVKIKQQILNGPQTPKYYQPPLDLWIKGNFFFNNDSNPLIVGGVYHKSRTITYKLESLSNILFVRINGQSYGYNTPECIAAVGRILPEPKILSAVLYANNLSMDPEVYNLYVNQIGYMIYRMHNMTTVTLTSPSGQQLLDRIRFPTESIRFGLQPISNQLIMDSWYKFTGITQNTIQTPIYMLDPDNGPPILSVANVRYNTIIQTFDQCGFYMKGSDNRLYDLLPPVFYANYLRTRQDLMFAPEDPGLMAILFNRKTSNEETSGYIDLTELRELYFNWTGNYISMQTPVRLVVCSKSVNIIEISSSAKGYNMKFIM